MMDKERIDKVLLDLKLCDSRTKAQSLVKSGMVLVNNVVVNKPNKIVSFDDKIEIISDPCPWVSRAGLKLSSAIKKLNINIKKDSICLDIGASTGGFSDVLLSHGVKQIFAVDVGYSQLHDKIRNNEKVVVIDKAARIHSWLGKAAKGYYQKYYLNLALNSKDPTTIISALKSISDGGRKFKNRPKAGRLSINAK